jgi:hypothetical protein
MLNVLCQLQLKCYTGKVFTLNVTFQLKYKTTHFRTMFICIFFCFDVKNSRLKFAKEI